MNQGMKRVQVVNGKEELNKAQQRLFQRCE